MGNDESEVAGRGNVLVTLSFPPADPEAVEIDPGAEPELPLNSGLTSVWNSAK